MSIPLDLKASEFCLNFEVIKSSQVRKSITTALQKWMYPQIEIHMGPLNVLQAERMLVKKWWKEAQQTQPHMCQYEKCASSHDWYRAALWKLRIRTPGHQSEHTEFAKQEKRWTRFGSSQTAERQTHSGLQYIVIRSTNHNSKV